jgi:hypothetical protein
MGLLLSLYGILRFFNVFLPIIRHRASIIILLNRKSNPLLENNCVFFNIFVKSYLNFQKLFHFSDFCDRIFTENAFLHIFGHH